MSSRRRLVSGSSRATNRRRQTQTANDNELSLELPPYQHPCSPLDANGQRALRELVDKNLDSRINSQAKESVKFLAATVGAINERLTIRRLEAAAARERDAKRRRANNEEIDGTTSAQVEEAEAKVRDLEERVEPLTLKLEAALRQVLDLKAALEDEKGIMTRIGDVVAARQNDISQEAQTSLEDGLIEVPGVSLYDIIQEGFKANAATYNTLNAFQKYAKHNDYIDFKRSWHEGLFPDQEVPVPNARTWFDADGQPQHVTGRTAGGNGEGDDSDEEIQIAREKRSFRCPLSLVQMTEPYTCRRCKHSFQKAAIFDYLNIKTVNSRGVSKPCPETGCQLAVSLFAFRLRVWIWTMTY